MCHIPQNPPRLSIEKTHSSTINYHNMCHPPTPVKTSSTTSGPIPFPVHSTFICKYIPLCVCPIASSRSHSVFPYLFHFVCCPLVINHRHDLRTASTTNELTSIFPLFPPLLRPFYRTLRFSQKQVFFRAGVLGQMEEFRDDRLSRIMTWMQSWCRGYLSRKSFKKMQEQRVSLEIVQRNLRKYMKLRTWAWWKLWQKVKPLLNVSRVEDQIAVSIRQRSSLPAAAAVRAANDVARFRDRKRSALTNVVTHRTKISFPSDYVGVLPAPSHISWQFSPGAQ